MNSNGSVLVKVIFLVAIVAAGVAGYFIFKPSISSVSGPVIPFKDGMQFTYAVHIASGGDQMDDSYTYSLTKTGDNWQTTETSGNYQTGDKQTLVLDPSGKVLQADSNHASRVGGVFNDLWLPPTERSVGTVVTIGFGIDSADYTVGQQASWGKWNVIPVASSDPSFQETIYYDVGTGWRVGSELISKDSGAKRTETLTNDSVL